LHPLTLSAISKDSTERLTPVESNTVDTQLILIVVGACGSALVGAIGHLYSRVEKVNKDTLVLLTTKLDACKEEHDQKEHQITELSVSVAKMEGRLCSHEANRDLIENNQKRIMELHEGILSVLTNPNTKIAQ